MDTLEPLDKLTKPAQEWCRSVGSNVTTVSEVIRNQDVSVLKAIQAGIDQANTRAVSRAAKVQKWSILPADFSIPGGELGRFTCKHHFRLKQKKVNCFRLKQKKKVNCFRLKQKKRLIVSD